MQRHASPAPLMRLLVLVWTALAESAFGPQGCVTLSRSSHGTCEFKTACQKQKNFEKLDFSFVCHTESGETTVNKFNNDGSIPRVGTWDSKHACAKCDPEKKDFKAAHSLVKNDDDADATDAPASDEETTEASDSDAEETTAAATTAAATTVVAIPPASAVFFGPKSCVSTYRNTGGTCTMQTQCDPDNTEGYEYGFICGMSNGTAVRHLMGTGSFDAKETFDTLIKCDLCLGLNQEGAGGDKTHDLVTDVTAIKAGVAALHDSVHEIKDHLGIGKEAESGGEESGDSEAGESDAGESDSGESDSGEADSGETDSGEADSGESDAGESDAGESDAGESDAGESDAGSEGETEGASLFMHKRDGRVRHHAHKRSSNVKDMRHKQRARPARRHH